MEDEDTLEFGSGEFYFKSEDEMRALFPDCPEAADNTQKIADRAMWEFEFGKTKRRALIRRTAATTANISAACVTRVCTNYYGENRKKKSQTALNMKFRRLIRWVYVNYYLIVYDFIRQAKSMGIPVGPGRGSGVGSLAHTASASRALTRCGMTCCSSAF